MVTDHTYHFSNGIAIAVIFVHFSRFNELKALMERNARCSNYRITSWLRMFHARFMDVVSESNDMCFLEQALATGSPIDSDLAITIINVRSIFCYFFHIERFTRFFR